MNNTAYRNTSRFSQIFEPTVTNVFVLQGLCLAAFLFAVFDPATMEWWLVSLFSYFILCNVGISLAMHRLYSHRNLLVPRWLDVGLALYGCTTMIGSPISYAYMHRLHHMHSDTDLDPHTPKKGALRSIFILDQPSKFQGRLIKDYLTDNFHIWVHQHFMLVVGFICLVVGVMSFNLLVYGILIPGLMLGIVQRAHNWVSHEPKFGTRNFESVDNSRNIWWWNVALMFCGEGWANNHHYSSEHYDYGKPTGGVDLVARLVDALILFKICRANNVLKRKSI